MNKEIETLRQETTPYFMSMADVPPSTFISTRSSGREHDDDMMYLVEMVERLRGHGDSPGLCHDIWHTAHFKSTEHADRFARWLDERAFCSIFRCHLDGGGWFVGAFNYGTTCLLDLIRWYCTVSEKVRECGGRYVECRVRVMCDEECDSD